MSWFDFFRQIFSGTGADDTGEGAAIRAGGKIATKTITLNANNTTANVNVFQITGDVKVLALYGRVKTATTLTNLTKAYFNVWDGTVQRDLTLNTGSTMSGFGVGAFFAKLRSSNVAMVVQNNSFGIFVEDTSNKLQFQQFFLIQKAATNTYVRFTYTTTDAPINAELEVCIEFADNNTGTIIPA